MARRWLVVLFVVVVMAVSGAEAWSLTSHRPLWKAGPVYVLVEGLRENAKDTGLTEDQIKTKVELELRSHGIPVGKASDRATLYVNVNIVGPNSYGLFAYHISIAHQEWVNLIRPGKLGTMATLWDTGATGISDELSFRDDVLNALGVHVDSYANGYLAANEKAKGK